MRIGIGFPIYLSNELHLDFAVQTLNSIKSEKHDLVFAGAVNHVANEEWLLKLAQSRETTFLYNNENNVSMAWNRTVEHLLKLGCRYVLVPNLDLILKENCLDRLVDFAEAHPEHILWTASAWADLRGIQSAPEDEGVAEAPHFSCFMVDARLFEKVGYFDENFRPAYNEDLDMHYRIKLASETAVIYGGARFYHFGSRTIKCDPELEKLNVATHSRGDQYFISKWGLKPPGAGDPKLTEGMYKFPYSDQTKPISYWQGNEKYYAKRQDDI